MSGICITRQACPARKPTHRHSCSTASCSARACCFSNAGRASARSYWRSRRKRCSANYRRGHASGRAWCRLRLSRALQLLGAFAVIAATLLDPLQTAVTVGGLVGVVLIQAGVHASLAGGLLGVFRIDRVRIDRGACRSSRRCGFLGFLLGFFLGGFLRSCRGCSRRSSSGSRRSVGTALGFPEVVPLLVAERTGGFGSLVLGA